MKKYNIKVNGVSYEVEVEEIGASGAAPTQQPAILKAAAPAPKAPAASAAAGAKTIKAPMPGTVLKLNAKSGAAVKKGDVLLVLEAMKMENDITAPEDGTVASVNVAQGASVNSGDVLLSYN